jgi:hypothetical protein
MSHREDAARAAAERWKDRERARYELRALVLELLQANKSMVEISEITGIKRTTLYYFVWGRNGKLGNAA